jgi:hypothetical protein
MLTQKQSILKGVTNIIKTSSILKSIKMIIPKILNINKKAIYVPTGIFSYFMLLKVIKNKNTKSESIMTLNEKRIKEIKSYYNSHPYLAYSNNPIFYIISNKNNILQEEVCEILKNNLKNILENNFPYISNYEIKFISIEEVEINKKFSIINKFIKEEKLSDMAINKLSPIDIEGIVCSSSQKNFKLDFNLKTRLENIILYEIINDYSQLRETFKYSLDDIDSSIILVPINNKSESHIRSISLFKDFKTKIILIENDELITMLKLEKDKIYEYLPPKLPNKIREIENYTTDIQASEIDINTMFLLNPINLVLNFGLFRDDYKLNPSTGELTVKNFKEFNFGFGYNERQSLKKLFYKNKNIKKLANVNESMIEESWKKKNKHYLFIYLPSYSFIKERVFEYILFGILFIYFYRNQSSFR